MLENQLYKVWCLSLESNTDRREWMLSIKDKIGLDFEFWNATTPNEAFLCWFFAYVIASSARSIPRTLAFGNTSAITVVV